MNITSDEILKNQFVKTPTSIQNLILSSEFESSLNTINATNDIEAEKRARIENEVVLVLLGLESLNDFEKNLKNNAGISQEKTQSVTKDIVEKIITPIEEDLRIFLEKELQEEEEEEISEIEKEEDVTTKKTEAITQRKEEEAVAEVVKAPVNELPLKKEVVDASTEKMRRVLRENSKTVSIKNLIANLK